MTVSMADIPVLHPAEVAPDYKEGLWMSSLTKRFLV
jgi:hypothetical protein